MDMKGLKKTLLAIAVLVLAVLAVPGKAEANSLINLYYGTSGLKFDSDVYLGHLDFRENDGKLIKWIVIDESLNGSVQLFSRYILSYSPLYSTDKLTGADKEFYDKDCDLQKECNNLAGRCLTKIECDSLNVSDVMKFPADLGNGQWNIWAGSAYFTPPTTNTLGKYTQSGDWDKVETCYIRGGDDSETGVHLTGTFWLMENDQRAYDPSNGRGGNNIKYPSSADKSLGVRPVTLLNKDSVLFTYEDIYCPNPGPTEIGENVIKKDHSTIELVLKDKTNAFQVDKVATDGYRFDISYSKAKKTSGGLDSYISVMVVDRNKEIKVYGRVAKVISEEGTATVDISKLVGNNPSLFKEVEDTLYIFNETVERVGNTYAYAGSPFQKISPAKNVDGFVKESLTNIAASNTSKTCEMGKDYVTILTPNEGYILPDSITLKGIDGKNLANNQFSYSKTDGKVVIENSVFDKHNEIEIIANGVVKTYELKSNKTDLTFDSKYYGYTISESDKKTLTLENTGNQAVEITLPSSKSFDISFSESTDKKKSLEAGKKCSLDIVPKTGLADGTYNETVTINYTNKKIDISVKFTVNRDTFNVTFETAHGIAPEVQPVKDKDKAVKPDDPSEAGYTFNCWMIGEDEYDFDTPVSEAKTLVADWSLNTYSISYTLNGGEVEDNPTAYTVETEETLTLTNPEKTGYEFTGWSGTGLTGAENKNVTVDVKQAKDLEFTANWTPIEYTITYDYDEGEAEGNPESYTIESNRIKLVNPTKEDFIFAGWSGTDLEGTANKVVSIPKGSIGNREYTANWYANTEAEHEYKVIVTDGTADVENAVKGFRVEINANAAPEGKEFERWAVIMGNVELEDANAANTEFTMPGEDAWVQAVYKEAVTEEDPEEEPIEEPEDELHKIYVIGGSSDVTEAKKDDIVTISTDNENFLKWSCFSDSIIFEDVESNPTTFVMGDDIVLIQIIEKNPYTEEEGYHLVRVYGGEADPQYAKEGDEVCITPLELEGYTFEEWLVQYGSIELTTHSDATTTFIMPDEKVSLIAILRAVEAPVIEEPTPNTITVLAGSADTDKAVAGTVVTISAMDAPEGKVFGGWVVDDGEIAFENAGSATTTFEMGETAVTLRATYKVKEQPRSNDDDDDDDTPPAQKKEETPVQEATQPVAVPGRRTTGAATQAPAPAPAVTEETPSEVVTVEEEKEVPTTPEITAEAPAPAVEDVVIADEDTAKASVEKNKSVAPFVYGGLGLLIVAAIVLCLYYRTKKNEAE